MRLYLSSQHFGDRIDLLLGMVRPDAKVGIIANALDLIPAERRAAYAATVHDPIAALRGHGLDAADLDLRTFFGKPEALADALAGLDMVWVTGGNAFLLARAMRRSGFDMLAPLLIRDDKLVYAGWSAGAVLATPDLRGIDLMDDPNHVAPGYDPAIVWDGLNLIGFHLVPHYDCGSADSPAAEAVTMYMLDQAMPYRTMRDGDVLVRDASGIKGYERPYP
jgi:dipeptidase E